LASGKERSTSLQSLATYSIPDGEVWTALGVSWALQGRQDKVVKPIAQARGAVAGQRPFPRPPWLSAVTGLAFEAFPGLAPRSSTEADSCGSPRGLHSPPERSSTAGIGSRRPSSRGIRRLCALSPACLSRVHSREPKPPSVRRCHPSNLVPPSWFLPTSTVSSARRSRVYCTPQPDKGSSRFALPAPVVRRPSEDGPEHGTLTVALPATRFTPFEVFPSSTAAPRHRGRCLLAVAVPPKRVDDSNR